jgi:hypothetical protein
MVEFNHLRFPLELGFMATHRLGPDNATLTVRTGRSGAIARVGHDLVIEVGKWSATLVLGEHSALVLKADSRSLKVLSGTGGLQPLGDDDKANIEQTINDEVLKGGTIKFHSSAVRSASDQLDVEGELELLGNRSPTTFELTLGDDGRLTGEAALKQSDWGIKPYSALFGTLKVADEVRVLVDGRLT